MGPIFGDRFDHSLPNQPPDTSAAALEEARRQAGGRDHAAADDGERDGDSCQPARSPDDQRQPSGGDARCGGGHRSATDGGEQPSHLQRQGEQERPRMQGRPRIGRGPCRTQPLGGSGRQHDAQVTAHQEGVASRATGSTGNRGGPGHGIELQPLGHGIERRKQAANDGGGQESIASCGRSRGSDQRAEHHHEGQPGCQPVATVIDTPPRVVRGKTRQRGHEERGGQDAERDHDGMAPDRARPAGAGQGESPQQEGRRAEEQRLFFFEDAVDAQVEERRDDEEQDQADALRETTRQRQRGTRGRLARCASPVRSRRGSPIPQCGRRLAPHGRSIQELRAAAMAAATRSGVNGTSRMRTPVASKMALPMAPATTVIAVSPLPHASASGWSISVIWMAGASNPADSVRYSASPPR